MNSVDDYWILESCGEDDSAVITQLPEEDGPEDWELHQCKPVADRFPEPLPLHFSDGFEKNIKLYDFVNNVFSLLIISDKVQQVFNSLSITQLEYLPVHLYDHQGNLAAENYFIVNLLDQQPIVDMEKSVYQIDALDKSAIDGIEELYLDMNSINPDAKLFYASNVHYLYFITDEVLQAMETADITGIRVIKAEGWDGLTLEF